MSCRTNCCTKFSLIFALLAMAVLAAPAFAQEPDDPCVQAAFGAHVTCTANDVSIAFADNPRHTDGTLFTAGNGCQAGSKFDFIADFHVTSTATSRSNIGLYFQTSGSGNAVTGATGTCENNVIAPPHLNKTSQVCLGSGSTPLNLTPSTCTGSGTYEEVDGVAPSGITVGCGDITTSDNNQVVTIEVDGADCVAGANGMLLLPNAVSWQQKGGIQLCTANAPNYSWDDTKTAVPGSTSKCSHNDTFTVPISVQSPTATVAKSCTTATSIQTNPPLTSCDAGKEGGTVTYHISVTNSSTFGTLTLNEICDTYYGTIALASGTAHPCWSSVVPTPPAPGTPSSTNNTCASQLGSAVVLGAAGSGNETFSCTFQASQDETQPSITDVAHAYGVGQNGTSGFHANSGSVTVTAEDADSKATITKGVDNRPESACFTVHYNVSVANTSASGSDESVLLTGLTDTVTGSATAWDLTKINTETGQTGSPIVGTTCGVATAKGTLIGASQVGGSFSAIAQGGNPYVCHFDAQICGTLGTVSGCSGNAISSTDTVAGTATGDEAETVAVTSGSKTVTECVTEAVQ